jgi:zinc/manganese transport system ATP-binding protein
MTQTGFAGVTLALGGKTVLSDIDLAFRPAEFVGVLGVNGAGKTTLMRAMLGLVAPTRGRIFVLGQPPRRGDRAIGYLPQSEASLPTARLRGWDIVASAVGGDRWGLPLLSPADRRDINRVLELVDGADLARREFQTLSGGERQRLRLAQALLGRPHLLLLDEPLSSLDPHHQTSVIALIRRLQLTLGITVLFSSHDLNPLLGAMDRVLYLGGGAAALGSVAEIVTTPVLSRLYGAPMEVVQVRDRTFVVAAGKHQIA